MGMTITITRGVADVYAGRVDEAAHRVVATLSAGDSRRITKVHADEVVSVQSKARFEYRIELPLRRSPPLPRRPTCVGAASCVVLASRTAYWHCDTVTCSGEPWVGQAVSWAPWAAQASNGRSGNSSRTVHSDDGSVLYPYMGPWADGCLITALSGTVLIVEWRRGSDSWRETVLEPGETHTIDLVGAEDSALIESPGISPFTVAVGNCAPPSQGLILRLLSREPITRQPLGTGRGRRRAWSSVNSARAERPV
jgi:hypothetical protein